MAVCSRCVRQTAWIDEIFWECSKKLLCVPSPQLTRILDPSGETMSITGEESTEDVERIRTDAVMVAKKNGWMDSAHQEALMSAPSRSGTGSRTYTTIDDCWRVVVVAPTLQVVIIIQRLAMVDQRSSSMGMEAFCRCIG